MPKDNLCETLDMNPIEAEIENIELPDDIDLDDLVVFAMKIFQESMNDSILAEPTEKAITREIALSALKAAQEAIVKKEELRLKERKQALDEYKAVSAKDDTAKLDDDNRAAILNRLRAEKENQG